MNRQPFLRHTGTFVSIPIDNIDTDQIIPSREMKVVGRTGLSDGLFAGWRYLPETDRSPDPNFILNQPAFSQATILVSGENFGCGSSREHAVWALYEFGFRVIIATSFGDIFFNNCIRNGVLPIRLTQKEIAYLLDHATSSKLTIDLPDQLILAGQKSIKFDINSYGKRLLAGGLDPISLTLQDAELIKQFHDADRTLRPWVYTVSGDRLGT